MAKTCSSSSFQVAYRVHVSFTTFVHIFINHSPKHSLNHKSQIEKWRKSDFITIGTSNLKAIDSIVTLKCPFINKSFVCSIQQPKCLPTKSNTCPQVISCLFMLFKIGWQSSACERLKKGEHLTKLYMSKILNETKSLWPPFPNQNLDSDVLVTLAVC